MDCSFVKDSDVVIIDATTKLGAGTAQEMVIAKYYNKPVLTLLPKNTHHRRTNCKFRCGVVKDWIHPFVYAFSDLIAEEIFSVINWINEFIDNPTSKQIKTMSVIDENIQKAKSKSLC